jgi:type VI secretion system protein VasG
MSIEVNWQALIHRLNPLTQRALLAAVGGATTRMHSEVLPEHLLQALLDDTGCDVGLVLDAFEILHGRVRTLLNRALEDMRAGNSGKPTFSPRLLEWIQSGWLHSSVDLGLDEIRSGGLMLALATRGTELLPSEFQGTLAKISAERLRKDFDSIVANSAEGSPGRASAAKAGNAPAAAPGAHTQSADSALGRFTIDFTAQAKAGKIDPIFGRDLEIRKVVDILGRRRKNNPILVGEAGVGKTAAVEGLALRIVKGDVPDVLKNVSLLSLDLGLLQAGAGVRGEFENRLRSVIDEVKKSEVPIILFIDEAHTLIGAGGPQGGGDAANLLKPALARGELRTIAATTWAEYKRYFETDPALTRRFQPVALDEPGEDSATVMMRGIKGIYEAHHDVAIRDDAVVAAVKLSNRYIEGRQLPDKAVDLLDTCAARVRVSRAATPARIETLQKQIEALEREREAVTRDGADQGRTDHERLGVLDEQIAAALAEVNTLDAKWQREKAAADVVLEARRQLREKPDDAELKARLDTANRELDVAREGEPFVAIEVDPDTVARTVSDWTGIPLGSMVRDQAQTILEFENRLNARIKGQDHALAAVGKALRAAKAGIGNPSAPMGVFFFVGSSGVGKTETALGIADLLFGGERFMKAINMSEFQEKHTVSLLKGSPPGYVGFGEGGILTEAVRQRPYSVVLLDEVEKAHPDVMNLFYQVFDKGTMTDGTGRDINFKNTIVVLTSNLGSELLEQMCAQETAPSTDELAAAVKPYLVQRFKAALNARWTIVPFRTIGPEIMREIVGLKLDRVGGRLRESHKIDFSYDPAVIDAIAARCTEVDTGARNVDHVVQSSLLPRISTEILTRMAGGTLPKSLHLSIAGDGAFDLAWQEHAAPAAV